MYVLMWFCYSFSHHKVHKQRLQVPPVRQGPARQCEADRDVLRGFPAHRRHAVRRRQPHNVGRHGSDGLGKGGRSGGAHQTEGAVAV